MRSPLFYLRVVVVCVSATCFSVQAATSFSTGAVDKYPKSTCGGPNLPLTIPEAASFRAWYTFAGLPLVTRWENGDVWGSDFRDGANADREPSGGSDLPNVYFFTGHGTCQSAPTSTDPDFIVTCSNNGQPNSTNIGTSSRWGNAGGALMFMFVDASCPMDLVSLGTNWFSPFAGLHVAVGNSGNRTHDTLDSEDRGSSFALSTVGFPLGNIDVFNLFPELPVTWAWMDAGLIDVESDVCAVSIANDLTEFMAIVRRDLEKVRSPLPRPSGNWFAWRWVCN